MSRHRKNRQHIVTSKCYDKRGRLISSATNSYTKSHPRQAQLAAKFGMPGRIFLHSELYAILKARGRKIHKIVVSRYDSLGNPKNACPCAGCMEAIRVAKINKIEYTLG